MSKQLHQRPRSEASLSDEYETPKELFDNLCYQYRISPRLDVCANDLNSKCHWHIPKALDGLTLSWKTTDGYVDVWCNPPHSKNEEFVRKAYDQWMKNNMNIIMILPANTCSSLYWHQCIQGNAEIHPIKGRIRFLVNGKPSEFPSRNAYICVIWRKRNEI